MNPMAHEWIRFCFLLVQLTGAQDGQAGVGGHGEGHVAVPAGAAADLAVVQAALLFRRLEAFLNSPPTARYADQLVQSGRRSPRAG
jgi:hypothetical protein